MPHDVVRIEKHLQVRVRSSSSLQRFPDDIIRLVDQLLHYGAFLFRLNDLLTGC